MEQKRIQTYVFLFRASLNHSKLMESSLEALENFVQINKTLLERTYADIERLKALRAEVEDGSVSSLQELTEKVRASPSR